MESIDKLETQPLNLHNDHNVYILGAGFSAPAGLPVIANFTNRMRDAFFWLRERGRTTEAGAVEAVLEFRSSASRATERIPLDLENIEHIFSLASASADVSLIRKATLAIAATLDYARTVNADEKSITLLVEQETLRRVPKDWPAPQLGSQRIAGLKPGSYVNIPLYDFYALALSGGPGQLSPSRKDTIITFNYDTLIDNGLSHIKVPFSYGFKEGTVKFDSSAICPQYPPDNAIQILKPHGSINWAVSGNDDRLTVFGDYSDVLARQLSPELVPPTWSKTFTQALSNVWSEMVRALATATRIIVLGYSIPETDQHFKYLLAAGLQRNVSLRIISFVNLDGEGVRTRVKNLFRTEELGSRLEPITPRNIEFFFKQYMESPKDQIQRINRALSLPYEGF